MTPDPEKLAQLFGYAQGVKVVVVTDRGVELPLNRSHGWSVLEVSEYIAEIDALPEVEPGSWGA